MPVGADNTARREPVDDCQNESPPPKVVDLATSAPLCGEAEFGELVDEMVADEAPRLFAVVQEYGTRVDARIAAWGMAFKDFAEIVGVDHGIRASLGSPERAARVYSRRPDVTASVVWVSPSPAEFGTLRAGPGDQVDSVSSLRTDIARR